MAAVLHDENIDCASIALYVGVLSPIQPLLEMFDSMMENISKPVAIWIYGPRLFSVAEMSRHLEARGLPTYFELETAVRALGMAARYAKVRMSLNNDVV